MTIFVSFNGFGPYLKKGRRRKSFEYLGDFRKLTDWTSREYFGLIAILKEEFEEMGFMKLVADLKFLNFI